MSETEQSTLTAIHVAAQEEFLARGFQAASLRQIVKKAGVTTGAFYGYYPSKEALFSALVEDVYEHFLYLFQAPIHQFQALEPEAQIAQMETYSAASLPDLLAYAFDHRKAFQLILCQSKGTRYAHLLEEMTRLEMQSTEAYFKVLAKLHKPVPQIDPKLQEILIRSMFQTIFDVLLQEENFEKATAYMEQLRAFYIAGWLKIMEA